MPVGFPLSNTYIQQNAVPGSYNLLPTSLPKWRKALANVLAGAGPARINWIGDSTTEGLGAGLRTQAMPYLAATRMTATGVASEQNSVLGSNNSSSSGVVAYDPRISFSGSAGIAAFTTLSGTGFSVFASGGQMNIAFGNVCDTIDFYYCINTGFGTGTLAYDGGAVQQTLVGNGTAAIGKATLSGLTAATHTLNIGWSSGAFYFIGAEAYLSTAPKVRQRNFGWSGALSTNWVATGNPWSPLTALGSATANNLGGDLSIIRLGTNDWWSGGPLVAVSVFTTQMQTLITQCQTTGDVLLCAPVYDNRTAQATAQPYVAALYSLAASNNVPLIDDSYAGSTAPYPRLYSRIPCIPMRRVIRI